MGQMYPVDATDGSCAVEEDWTGNNVGKDEIDEMMMAASSN